MKLLFNFKLLNSGFYFNYKQFRSNKHYNINRECLRLRLQGLLFSSSAFCDVSHLTHHGYPTHKPDHPLELPGQSAIDTSVTGYPVEKPDQSFELPGQSTTGTESAAELPKVDLEAPTYSEATRDQIPNIQEQGAGSGTGLSIEQRVTEEKSHDHHHYHGEDGKYNPNDDGTGWDIRKSIPGEPDQDYPIYDSVPSTSFTCKQKVPGYYADEETRCQAFRICTTDSFKTAYSFLCPNGTLFNQRVLTCDWWLNVDCESSSEFFFKNQEIGKMPTGQQLMTKVTMMLQAPDGNPYYFTQQQTDAVGYMINRNKVDSSESGFSLTPEITTTTKKYVPPATTTTRIYVPPSTTTARIYVPPPTTTTTRIYVPPPTTTTTTTTTTPRPIVSTETFLNVIPKDDVPQQSNENVQNQYIPPTADQASSQQFTPVVEQTNVQKQQHTQIDTSSAGVSGFEQKINQYDENVDSGYVYPKQTVTLSTGFRTNQQNQPVPTLTVTKSHSVTQSQKTTHVFQNVQDGPEKISLVDNHNIVSTSAPPVAETGVKQIQQPIIQHQSGISQTGFSGVQGSRVGTQFGQFDQNVVKQQNIPNVQNFIGSTVKPSGFTLTKEDAFEQINKIQTGLNRITEQQNQLNNFGQGVVMPRISPPSIQVPSFGQNVDFSQLGFGGVQNTQIPQGFTHQGVQPTLFNTQSFPVQSYIQNQGYQYQKPIFHQQNGQRFNYQANNRQNLYTQVYRGGQANQFTGQQTQNIRFKETTKVDIVPALSFHLNDASEKNSYFSAVSQGLISDKPSHYTSGSSNFGQSGFSPSDVRFSSYQGPSSYLVPQSSVQKLPNDSGYRYR